MPMSMENITKKRFLSQYYKAKLRIRIIQEQIEELETLAGGGAINIKAAPGGKFHNYDPVQTNAVKIGDLLTKLENEKKQAMEKALIAQDAINTVTEENENAVLTLRYIRCKRWEVIAEELGYSEPHLYKIHDKALADIDDKKIKMIVNDSE